MPLSANERKRRQLHREALGEYSTLVDLPGEILSFLIDQKYLSLENLEDRIKRGEALKRFLQDQWGDFTV
jgi:hypothetical protein